MTDEGGERVRGRRSDQPPVEGWTSTGSDVISEGSSVETERDIATEEEVPSTEEIMEMDEETHRREGTSHGQSGASGRAAREEEDAEIFAPHERGDMKEIE